MWPVEFLLGPLLVSKRLLWQRVHFSEKCSVGHPLTEESTLVKIPTPKVPYSMPMFI